MNLVTERYARVLAGLVALCAMLLVVSSAQGATRDRNHDGLPDRWEKAHGLSLKKNQAKRDQDLDHVSNLCEFQAGTDPRDADADDDGIRDGREDSDGDGVSNAHESHSHGDCGQDESDDDNGATGSTGATGDGEVAGTIASLVENVLTITLADGSEVSAPLAADVKIECEGAAPPVVLTVASSHDGSGGTSDDGAEAGDDDSGATCGEAQLVPGTVVQEAKLMDGVFVKIELQI
ncbi:MAG: hypothetical protein JHC87_09035 [Thermoleophilaceae bacterium]|nr:hypothetical protein [Thermoleophilaceae bacterium]